MNNAAFCAGMEEFMETTLDEDIINADKVQHEAAHARAELIRQALTQAANASIVTEGDNRDDLDTINTKLRIQAHALNVLKEQEAAYRGRARLKISQREVATVENNSAILSQLLRSLGAAPPATNDAGLAPLDLDRAAGDLEATYGDTVSDGELITDPAQGIDVRLAHVAGTSVAKDKK